MNDGVEQRLAQLTRRGIPPELRSRVLNAVAAELDADAERVRGATKPVSVLSTMRRHMLGVAALLLVGVGLNLWVNRTLDRRLAAVFGPPPVRKLATDIAADVASVTDRRTGQWIYRRLAEGQPTHPAAHEYPARLDQAIRKLTVEIKEPAHEANQKNSHLDRHLRCRGDRHFADVQRLVCLEHGNTA